MKVILDVLYQECEELSRDKFGNFLIQYILDMCCSNMTKMSNSIIKKMRRKFKQLLFNKNAYYVALKVFRYTTENERKKIIKMLMNVKNIEVSWKNKIFRRVFKSIIDNLNDKEAKYAFELMSAKKIKIDKLKAIIYSKISQNQNL